MIFTRIVLGLPIAVAACGLASAASAAEGKERFYGKEKFSIVYTQTGAEAGDITEHVRDWGRTRAEITKTLTQMAGIKIDKDQRVVYERSQVTTIDNKTGSISTTRNALYDDVVAEMKGESGVDFGERIMRSMGGQKTGETGKFAGHPCIYYTLAGIRTCVTDWGGTLHTVAAFGPIGYERTAIEVKVGDGGPDNAFAYDTSKAVATPTLDLDALRGKMKGQ